MMEEAKGHKPSHRTKTIICHMQALGQEHQPETGQVHQPKADQVHQLKAGKPQEPLLIRAEPMDNSPETREDIILHRQKTG